MDTYLRRDAFSPVARRRTRMARYQAAARRRKGQLSVLIDKSTLERWRAYVVSRQVGDDPMSGAEILEELIDRELRRNRR